MDMTTLNNELMQLASERQAAQQKQGDTSVIDARINQVTM
jgi:hypothetical protein